MTVVDHQTLVARWARLGAAFSVALARRTPDVEQLLLDTVRLSAGDSRVFIMAMTWLGEFGFLVARHRLARMIATELEREHRPAMGLLLELAEACGAGPHLRIAVRACAAADVPGPLFEIDRENETTVQRAERRASEVSKRWGLWVEELEPKPDALRSARWVIDRNPDLKFRADFKGDLRASVLAEIRRDPAAGASEMELARRCGATRMAVRSSLADLEAAGWVGRVVKGRRRGVVVRSAA